MLARLTGIFDVKYLILLNKQCEVTKMKRNFLINCFSLSLVALSTASANSACIYPGYQFRFLDEVVSVNVVIDSQPANYSSGKRDIRLCEHNFYAGGHLSFKSISIVKRPRNGNFNQRTVATFEYKPKNGFSGPDAYSIKVCGERRGQLGCSTIEYNVTVK